jgi:hypothetical protein
MEAPRLLAPLPALCVLLGLTAHLVQLAAHAVADKLAALGQQCAGTALQPASALVE